ncbi:hypothetical protein FNV43_RR08844 [Rhamnella rubrinervis]|uniref:Uncharacterized protein n=1 Tax=Rhamnella rubrinervis TaxID=2594499 RepID=A0A8K0MJM8_9ROSA|nr:hypothetical protein FNV43_RR08844 [Rhamnella rubrinervis]
MICRTSRIGANDMSYLKDRCKLPNYIQLPAPRACERANSLRHGSIFPPHHQYGVALLRVSAWETTAEQLALPPWTYSLEVRPSESQLTKSLKVSPSLEVPYIHILEGCIRLLCGEATDPLWLAQSSRYLLEAFMREDNAFKKKAAAYSNILATNKTLKEDGLYLKQVVVEANTEPNNLRRGGLKLIEKEKVLASLGQGFSRVAAEHGTLDERARPSTNARNVSSAAQPSCGDVK